MKKKTRILLFLAVFAGAFLLQPLLSRVTVPPLHVGLLALAGGALAGNLLTQLGLAALARPAGLAPAFYLVGSGRRSRTVRLGRCPLVLRSVPLPFFAAAYQLVPGPRWRAWAAVTAAYLPAPLLGGWLLATTAGAWQLFGLVLTAALVELAVQAAFPGCPGWVVLRMPAASPAALAEVYATPGQVAAARALEGGRIADAAAALAAEPETGTLADGVARVRVLLATGEWAAALERAERITVAAPVARVGWLADLARAEALVCAADAGLLPPAEYLPRLAAAVDAVSGRRPGAAVRADLHRLRGEREQAVKHASAAARRSVDAWGTADAACSLAAALLASGRPEQARRALARAHGVLPGLARTALVEQRAAAVVLD
ncbi:hypothetical protein [Kitasatospora phosalacinea]|uniref:Uncharacterized protein n=1 Tax=Kitasatospora phosalacinea TaxID=2065 RepID=A0A9W6US69_9ACTN|nr:hypothetical protein [Kitasatospora phosalacinea]GLW59129.1 hypothetical protein Kpho01_71390 [Kitasatospora phosalacinea]